MTTTIIISSIILIAVAATVFLIYRKKKSSGEELSEELQQTVEKVKENLKDDLKGSATDLVKAFLWYTQFDPNKPTDQQTRFNRQKRRRIKRHYQKFLWKWMDIPEEIRDVRMIVEYLAASKWETRVVRRYIQIFKDETKTGKKDDEQD